MAKAKVKQRKDSKGRVLQKGESQRKLDGMYIYTYVNPYGKRCYVYSKDLFTLREKEQELIKAQMDGLDYYVGGHATINMTFDRYMSTKHNLRETTRSNYLYMFNRFIRADFGNKFLTEVKYTDVKLFYYHLLNEKDIAINTLDTIHTVLHPIFDMAVRDDIIRKNPTDGVLAEIKRNSGKNKGIRHALTIEQQDPYMFDFIDYTEEMLETDIENELVKNVTSLLMELGTGFAFMGQQYHLEVGGKDFYIDLLFYNTKLRCYVAIDLKTGEFKPEQAGKMNFYLSALDDLVKAPEDNPSVGLILCRDENRTIAEYALRDMSKPIGVSEYHLCTDLPLDLKNALPAVEDIRSRIDMKK